MGKQGGGIWETRNKGDVYAKRKPSESVLKGLFHRQVD
jgi:hypothetical protein